MNNLIDMVLILGVGAGVLVFLCGTAMIVTTINNWWSRK